MTRRHIPCNGTRMSGKPMIGLGRKQGLQHQAALQCEDIMVKYGNPPHVRDHQKAALSAYFLLHFFYCRVAGLGIVRFAADAEGRNADALQHQHFGLLGMVWMGVMAQEILCGNSACFTVAYGNDSIRGAGALRLVRRGRDFSQLPVWPLAPGSESLAPPPGTRRIHY